jgi:hypothetical protein
MPKNTIKIYSYKGTSLMSKLIKFRTGGEYSHIAIGIDGWVYEAWVGAGSSGVVKSRSPYGYHTKDTQFEVLEVPMNNKANFKIFLEGQVGKEYDWRAILSFAFNWNKNNPNEWFCSELADQFFKYEVENYYKETKLVSPSLFTDKIKAYLMGLQNQIKK